jgi:hypothetical protein
MLTHPGAVRGALTPGYIGACRLIAAMITVTGTAP